MECQCEKCRSACERMPGLFTPDEAMAAIAAGFADRMMAVGYHDERGTYRALAPLTMPLDGEYLATAITPHLRLETAAAKGRCTFYASDRLYEIHCSGFKPGECAAAMLCAADKDRSSGRNASIRDSWSSREGRQIVMNWELARSGAIARLDAKPDTAERLVRRAVSDTEASRPYIRGSNTED
jgi:hypothetical protein